MYGVMVVMVMIAPQVMTQSSLVDICLLHPVSRLALQTYISLYMSLAIMISLTLLPKLFLFLFFDEKCTF